MKTLLRLKRCFRKQWLVPTRGCIPIAVMRNMICFDLVVVDTKTIEEITDHEIGKMLNYLKVTNLQVGLLINFQHPKLEFKRVVRS